MRRIQRAFPTGGRRKVGPFKIYGRLDAVGPSHSCPISLPRSSPATSCAANPDRTRPTIETTRRQVLAVCRSLISVWNKRGKTSAPQPKTSNPRRRIASAAILVRRWLAVELMVLEGGRKGMWGGRDTWCLSNNTAWSMSFHRTGLITHIARRRLTNHATAGHGQILISPCRSRCRG